MIPYKFKKSRIVFIFLVDSHFLRTIGYFSWHIIDVSFSTTTVYEFFNLSKFWCRPRVSAPAFEVEAIAMRYQDDQILKKFSKDCICNIFLSGLSVYNCCFYLYFR